LLHRGGLDSALLSWGSPRIWGPAWSAITGLGLESSKLGAVAPSALHPKPGRWWSRSTALVVSLDSYDLATVERGWRPDEVEQWWHASLSELLLR
jgi:hypothetical protein